MSVGGILAFIWPFIVFVILFPIAHSTWIAWRQEIYEHDIAWVLLEIRMPREVKKSPQAMEQVLYAIHSLRNTANDLQEIYWDGEVTRWYSLEAASFGGEIHFYIRTYNKQRPLVEAAFFSYYPDVELVEVSDYFDAFPSNLKDIQEGGLEMWGTEITLAREGAYPIRTYPTFESPDEESQYDPIAELVEVLGKAKKGELVALQILIQPAHDDWHKEFNHLVEKLRETKTKKEVFTSTEGITESFARFLARSPGETDILKAVEANIAKPAFETLIRYVYVSPKTLFYEGYARRALFGTFNQYAALDLNRFVRNERTATRVKIWYFPYLFPKRRKLYRTERLLTDYRHRTITKETFMGKLVSSYIMNLNFAHRPFPMSAEGLATIFHPPTIYVLTAPHIVRVESRKTGPPAGMAIYGEEKAIEGFK